ncbi:MliC family protein [Bartonella sp. B41]
MKKTSLILRFLTALSISLFISANAFAGSLVIEVPDDANPTTETVSYLCDTGTGKEHIKATYLNAGNISLVDFTWKGNRVVGSNVISASGVKYMGAQYIWWNSKNEVTFYDLISDPEEKKPILCVEEKSTK